MELGKINFGPALVNGVGPNKARELWQAAQAVNVAESSSPMPGLSPKLEQRVPQSHLGPGAAMDRIEAALKRMEASQSRQESILLKIIEALAEDQDPDEMPATYMDGSPVR